MATKMLEKKFAQPKVTTVTSGREALDLLLNGTPFDLILCDYRMEGVNGIDVFEKMKAANIDIPFILCSYESRADQKKLGREGMLGVVSKLDFDHLLTTLSRKLKTSGIEASKLN